jgi:hypothetical protein
MPSQDLYTNGAILDFEDTTFTLVRPKITYSRLDNDVQYHTVMEDERIDQIAYKYYGSNRYWFVIADFNDIDDSLINPFSDLVAGTTLIIPSINSLEF